MCFYIGIEDLAANALIEAMGKDKRELTYEEIEKYGAEVVHLLDEQETKAVLILSRERTSALFRNYSNFFEEAIINGKDGIALKDGTEVKDLVETFRGYLALDVLIAFCSQRSVKVLGV